MRKHKRSIWFNAVSDVPHPLRRKAVSGPSGCRRRDLGPKASCPPRTALTAAVTGSSRVPVLTGPPVLGLSALHPLLPQVHMPASSVRPREAPAFRVSVSLKRKIVLVTRNTPGVSRASSACHYVQTEDVTTCICFHRRHLAPKVQNRPSVTHSNEEASTKSFRNL